MDYQNQNTMMAAMMLQILNKHFCLAKHAHLIHLNVRGMLFPQFHEMFKTIYEALYDDVDLIAEKLRALGCLAEFGSYNDNENFIEIDTKNALEIYLSYELELKDLLVEANIFANQINNFSMSNFLSDQIDKHEKTIWMIDTLLD